MSQVETSAGGNPLRTINASSGPEPYTLPTLASGRSITIRREDSGTSGNAVVVSVPSGHYLDGVLNGTVTFPGNSQYVFYAINPGIWESYGAGGDFAATDPLVTITRAADGSIASVTQDGVTTTYARNTDGTIASQTRKGITRTYTRDATGNLTGIA